MNRTGVIIPEKKKIHFLILIWTILLLFGYQIINQSVYTHTHILIDGTVITHAHPYKKSTDKSPGKNHQHTCSQLFLLGNPVILFTVLSFALVLIRAGLLSKKKSVYLIHYSSDFFVRLKGRSPPLIMF